MIQKLYRRAASLSVATLLVGTALPAMAQSDVQAIPVEQIEAPVSPNPAHDPQFVLANLTEVSPFNLSFVIADEWKKGNKLRASFWYFIWQIRTDAWVNGVNDQSFMLFRTMMNDEMGQAINPWILSDPALMRDTAQRAIAYEAKLPLSKQQPDGMSEADWLAVVSKARADYASDMRDAFDGITDEEILATRQRNGFAVGTPSDQGAPLDEAWR